MPRPLLLCALALLAGAASPSHANTVRYQICGGPVVVVPDGGVQDLSGAADIIKVHISTVVPWGIGKVSVDGWITAIDSPPVTGKPSLSVSNLRITNAAGNIIAAPIWIEHQFAVTTSLVFNDQFAGRFDSVTTPGTLGGGSLTYLSRVRSVALGWKTIASGAAGPFVGAGPFPFSFAGGPATWSKVSLERQDLTFYLDSPGDSILVFPTDHCKLSAAWLLPLAGWRVGARSRRP